MFTLEEDGPVYSMHWLVPPGRHEYRQVIQEGLRIPPIKLFEQGKLNERLFEVIAANIRQPETTIGDLRAQTAALEIGRDGITDYRGRYRDYARRNEDHLDREAVAAKARREKRAARKRNRSKAP